MVVGLVVGRMKGKQGPSPSPVGFPSVFWRRDELGLQLSKLRLSASGREMPAAIQAEELTVWRQGTSWPQRTRGKGELLGFPMKCCFCLLWLSACSCRQFSAAVETWVFPQQCSPGAGGPGLEG